jgi:putative sensory transduction regulator
MATETLSPLQTLVAPLEELEYFCDHRPVGNETPYESLYISLNVDEERPERAYGLEMFFLNDLAESLGDEEQEEDAIIAQFMLVLPFPIPVEAYLDVMRYCGLVNRLMPVGAFGLSEDDGAVYLRHCLATADRIIPEIVLIEVVTALEYACKEYGAQFEELSTGKKTYEDHVARFDEAGLPIPSVGHPDALATTAEES